MTNILIADEFGEIIDHPELQLAGGTGGQIVPVREEELISLPEGSKFFTMPGRFPMGYDQEMGRFYEIEDLGQLFDEKGPVQSVAAFLPPGYLRLYTPAYACSEDAPTLPLWAYCAAGWKDEQFVVPALKVDDLWYWHPEEFDDRDLVPLVEQRLAEQPENRLLEHLAHCALTYHCFAAKNLFYSRGEAPLPVAPACNCACIGCLSLQQEEGCQSSHERIKFVPTPEEIIEVAVPHLEKVPEAIVSFGQGCEGDPICYGKTLVAAIEGMRERTDKGTIHLNTNGSLPEVIEQIAGAGLDSIRISLNSTIKRRYLKYYRPQNYQFEDVIRGIKTASDHGLHVAINLLVFPGITDLPEEVEGLRKIIDDCGVNMIQLRNLNIDPELYLDAVGVPKPFGVGLQKMVKELQRDYPDLTLGYFNRPFKKPLP